MERFAASSRERREGRLRNSGELFGASRGGRRSGILGSLSEWSHAVLSGLTMRTVFGLDAAWVLESVCGRSLERRWARLRICGDGALRGEVSTGPFELCGVIKAFGSSGSASSSTASRLARGAERRERNFRTVFGSKGREVLGSRCRRPVSAEGIEIFEGRRGRSSDRPGRPEEVAVFEGLLAHGGRDRRARTSCAFGSRAGRVRDATSSRLEAFWVLGGRSRSSFGG
jgi:hypothetical protein